MTARELNQQIVDLIDASGFKGSAVLVLMYTNAEGDMETTIGANTDKRATIAAVLVAAAHMAIDADNTPRQLNITPRKPQ